LYDNRGTARGEGPQMTLMQDFEKVDDGDAIS
jgi:hypothetical protein